MTLAVIRADPALMSKQVSAFKQNPMCKGQSVTPLVQHLIQLTPLPIATLDSNASKACRINTAAKLSQETEQKKDTMELRGNCEAFCGMPGDGSDIVLEDETKLGWTGSAQELIIFMLI